ncbi:MAG TPA: hypothetical protein VFC63_21975 [Blastocatellia bacterium]|nr:hypothetical protein [Blastocatellia bacterium]
MNESQFHFATTSEVLDQPVTLQFQDGNQVVPGWMVAHLGGPEKVIADLSGYVVKISFEDFTRDFFQEAASQQLRAIYMSILNNQHRGPRVDH